MRKLIVSVAFLAATSALACSFEVGSGKPAQTPPSPAPPAATPAAPGQPAPAASPPAAAKPAPIRTIGRAKVLTPTTPPGLSPTPTTPTTPTTPPTTPPAGGIPVMTGANLFGSGTADLTGFKGNLYAIPAGTTKLPALGTLAPIGVLFAKDLNVALHAMSGGFPGIDPNKNESFAIRFEAPLIVENEADYTFRVVSDDGSIVSIDTMPIVDNDGAHGTAEKSGPVHLVKGTHVLTVDYFQTTGSVQLQLFCKRAGQAETVCPTRL